MPSRNMAIRDDVYRRLSEAKAEGESFSDVIDRLLEGKSGLMSFAGALSGAFWALIPGVLGNEVSALSDSFQNQLISPPVYTRPRNFKGWEVPDILLSGNEKLIEEWKYDQSLKRTKERRPDLLKD